jgi:peptide/nickel transport system permease protein
MQAATTTINLRRRGRVAAWWRVMRQRPAAFFGVVVIAVFVITAVFAPWVAPYPPNDRSGTPFESPSRAHLLGTNDIGEDVLSDLIYASRVSILVGVVAAAFITIAGLLIGILAGYFRGGLDEVLMRVTDVIIALPRLPLMLVMAAYLGAGTGTIIFVIAVVGWPSLARQVRSQVLSVRESTFVEAARATGAGSGRIMARSILPAIAGIVIANGVMEIMFAILTEAGLSFLGLGDPTHQSWGVMLYFAQAQGAFLRGAWWWIFPPGVCIALFCLACNFIGTSINDLFGLRLGRR